MKEIETNETSKAHKEKNEMENEENKRMNPIVSMDAIRIADDQMEQIRKVKILFLFYFARLHSVHLYVLDSTRKGLSQGYIGI